MSETLGSIGGSWRIVGFDVSLYGATLSFFITKQNGRPVLSM